MMSYIVHTECLLTREIMRLVLVHVRASAGVAFFPFRGGLSLRTKTLEWRRSTPPFFSLWLDVTPSDQSDNSFPLFLPPLLVKKLSHWLTTKLLECFFSHLASPPFSQAFFQSTGVPLLCVLGCQKNHHWLGRPHGD